MTENNDSQEWYRNDPAATFDAHLFEGENVAAAGVENGGQADHPVASICSRTTSYGPFKPVPEGDVNAENLPGFDGDLCAECAKVATARNRDAEDEA